MSFPGSVSLPLISPLVGPQACSTVTSFLRGFCGSEGRGPRACKTSALPAKKAISHHGLSAMSAKMEKGRLPDSKTCQTTKAIGVGSGLSPGDAGGPTQSHSPGKA